MQEAEADRLLTRAQVADLLRLSTCTVDAWRERHRGPKYIRLSKRAIRYRLADVQEFIRRNEVSAEQ